MYSFKQMLMILVLLCMTVGLAEGYFNTLIDNEFQGFFVGSGVSATGTKLMQRDSTIDVYGTLLWKAGIGVSNEFGIYLSSVLIRFDSTSIYFKPRLNFIKFFGNGSENDSGDVWGHGSNKNLPRYYFRVLASLNDQGVEIDKEKHKGNNLIFGGGLGLRLYRKIVLDGVLEYERRLFNKRNRPDDIDKMSFILSVNYLLY